jgi:glutamate-5-semialdehyde dehydrogenase
VNVKEIAKYAKIISTSMQYQDLEFRNKTLELMAMKISRKKEEIFAANVRDLKKAKSLMKKGEISAATYGRLELSENKMRDMLEGIYDVANLPDPIGKVPLWSKKLDDGLILEKVSCPIGVIGVIFEARPDVISQISALAIKSGNTVLLKGGKESSETNLTIFEAIQKALPKEFKNAVNLLESREDVAEMLELDDYINLIIPRGSNELVKYIQDNTKIPVLGHAAGVCHIYVDKDADYLMAKDICIDAKTQYPSACNAVETILVHDEFPHIVELRAALEAAGVEIKEGEKYWGVEFSDTVACLRVVNNELSAIEHINTYGSGHTDSIITANDYVAGLFMDAVDSSGVYHNCSTRFADGFRYGFGAEVGISTNKTHARGPVGLDGLTIYKYKLKGSGQIVDDYCKGTKIFKHEMLS